MASTTLAVVLSACAAGQGTGRVRGAVFAPECSRTPNRDYELLPTYFSAEASGNSTQIRIQRTSGDPNVTDGVFIQVIDATRVARELLNVPIPVGPSVGPGGVVAMTFHYNQSCFSDYSMSVQKPSQYVGAESGTLTFSQIYAPRVDANQLVVRGTFENVEFRDRAVGGRLEATLSGTFDFIFNRGRPAQRFP